MKNSQLQYSSITRGAAISPHQSFAKHVAELEENRPRKSKKIRRNSENRKRYWENLVENRARSKRCYTANRDRILAKKPNALMRARKNSTSRASWLANRDAELSRGRAYYASHREQVAARITEYRRRNPDIIQNYFRKRRALKKNVQINVTPQSVVVRVELYGHSCCYCGGLYEHLDHVKPMSKFGSHTPASLRPSCKICNLRKSSSTLSAWSSRFGHEFTGIPKPNLPDWF